MANINLDPFGSVANFLTALINFLNVDDNPRRALRIVKRTYKKFKKEFKKDGLTESEKRILEDLRDNIIKRTLELE